MNVNVNITLEQDDLDRGVTVQSAILKAFPTLQGTLQECEPMAVVVPSNLSTVDPHHQHVHGSVESPGSEPPETRNTPAPTVNEPAAAPPPSDTEEVDSAGIPWNADLHSGNRKKYDNGRWHWKRGTNKDTREQEALALKVEAAPAAPTTLVVGDAYTSPAPGPVADNAVPAASFSPVPDNAAPVAPGPVPDNAAPTAAGGTLTAPITFPQFVQAITRHGKDAAAINDALGRAGVEEIALLADDAAQAKRDEVASYLGFLA